jgi:hypothetical protein
MRLLQILQVEVFDKLRLRCEFMVLYCFAIKSFDCQADLCYTTVSEKSL